MSAGSLPEAALGFFQMGYFFLPLFFMAGAWAANRKREFFALLLFFCAIAVFLSSADEGLNAFFPAFDGIRLLPSFALPAFFLSGFGAAEIFFFSVAASEKLRLRMGQDKETFSGCVALALLLPLSFLFLSGVVMTWDQLRADATPLAIASEYLSLQKADALSGGGRIAFVWRSEVSQYPVKDDMVGRMPLSYFSNASALADEMAARGAVLVVFGNEEAVLDPANLSQKTKWAQYSEMRASPDFKELLPSGSLPLFSLKSATFRQAAWGENVMVERSEIETDRIRVAGECLAQGCDMTVYSYEMPKYSGCTASYGSCNATWNKRGGYFQVVGIPQGKFEVEIAPRLKDIHYYSMAASLIALACCVYVLKRQ